MNRKNLIIILMVMLVSGTALSKPPKISGNIEQGTRYPLPHDEIGFPTPWIEATEEYPVESWAYNFHKGHLQLAQKVSKNFRYVVKYNYIWKDFYAAETNNKNILSNYRVYSWIKLSKDFNLRIEYYIRQQNYNYRPWDNFTYVPHILLKWKITDKRKADVSLRSKFQRYSDPGQIWKDKNQISAGLGYKEEIGERLTLKAKYNYTFRRYTDNRDETNAVKKSLSAGFDYQF